MNIDKEIKSLTYFELDSMKPIPLKFKSFEHLCSWIDNLDMQKSTTTKTVYLFSCTEMFGEREDTEIFVTENLSLINEVISTKELEFSFCIDFHLQEYESFEDAYAVALSMREGNPLCYNNTEKL